MVTVTAIVAGLMEGGCAAESGSTPDSPNLETLNAKLVTSFVPGAGPYTEERPKVPEIARPPAVQCPPKGQERVKIVIQTKRLSMRKHNEFAKLLKEDKVRLLFLKDRPPDGAPQITATLKAKRFGRRFKGEMRYVLATDPKSGQPYCRPIVKSVFIPFEYREFVHSIEAPERLFTPPPQSTEQDELPL